MGFPKRAARSFRSNNGRTHQRAASGCLVESLEDRRLLSLTIDVRLAAIHGGGKSLLVENTEQSVKLDVWAIVTGQNDNGADDGFQGVMGSFLSSDVSGGAVRGNLAAVLASSFNGLGSTAGTRVDLDGDGDADIGHNDDADTATNAFFTARSGGITTDGTVQGRFNSFYIATLTFRPTQLLAGSATHINFRLRQSQFVATWMEDGQLRSSAQGLGAISSGSPVILTSPGPVDAAPPQAELNAADITVGGGVTHQFTVTYTDDVAVKRATLDSNDLVVVGPKKQKYAATLVSTSLDGNGTPIAATYSVKAPGGYWDRWDNGAYQVWLKANQVSDAAGKFAASRQLGTFSVNSPAAVRFGKTLIVSGTNSRNSITLSPQGKSLIASVDGANVSFALKTIAAIEVYAYGNHDIVTVNAGLTAAKVDGGSGNDRLTGGSGNDTLIGGAGNDLISGGDGNDQIQGDGGKDKLYGMAGKDVLNGGSGMDLLDGGDGNDALFARDGEIDSLYGGGGYDAAAWNKGDGRKAIEKLLK